MNIRNKYIGNKQFYIMVLGIAVPIMVQSGITNFVNMIDNLMVGQLGTEEMSGVAIINLFVLVFNLCVFGAVSGAGLFTAQFFGKNDIEGVRYTMRFKIIAAVVIMLIAFAVFILFGQDLISLYLDGESDGGNLQLTLQSGWKYLLCLLPGVVPFAIEQCYASTLREGGETVLPMKAGIAAVIVNVVFNYLLIYGKFGFPELGVMGAGLATSLSRYVEAAIVIIWTHRHVKQNPFIVGLYKSFYIPGYLVKDIIKTGMPLLVNEALWSAGFAILTQCYSLRGLNVIAGYNITSTIFNVFNVVVLSMGTAIAIIVGQRLGAGLLEEARDIDNKLIAFSIMCGAGLGILMIAMSPLFPELYNTTENAKDIATGFMILQGLFFPQFAFINAAYFTLRCGGKTIVTFLFDSVYVWIISIPIAFVLSRFTGMHIFLIFAIVNIADWIKCILGFILIKKGVWIKNIVDKE